PPSSTSPRTEREREREIEIHTHTNTHTHMCAEREGEICMSVLNESFTTSYVRSFNSIYTYRHTFKNQLIPNHTHIIARTPTHAHSHTHTHSLSHTHTHTLTHTHTHTHTLSTSPTPFTWSDSRQPNSHTQHRRDGPCVCSLTHHHREGQCAP